MTEAEKAAKLKKMASRHKLEVEASQAQVHCVIIVSFITSYYVMLSHNCPHYVMIRFMS